MALILRQSRAVHSLPLADESGDEGPLIEPFSGPALFFMTQSLAEAFGVGSGDGAFLCDPEIESVPTVGAFVESWIGTLRNLGLLEGGKR